jgi:hypothetical protein
LSPAIWITVHPLESVTFHLVYASDEAACDDSVRCKGAAIVRLARLAG